MQSSATDEYTLHEDTLDWLTSNPGLLAAYEGTWVALSDRSIIASHPSFAEATRLARERGVDDPLLVPVRPANAVFG